MHRSPLPRPLRLLLAPLAALVAGGLSSCYVDDVGPPYSSYGGVRTSPAYGYGYGYRSAGYGRPPLFRSSYYGSHHHHSDHHHHYRHDEDRIKLTGGSQRGKPNRPEGYHTREWYERRGYDLDKYKHKHEASGDVHAGRDYARRSSSSRSRSHSSHSEHPRPRSSSSADRSRSSRSSASSDSHSHSHRKGSTSTRTRSSESSDSHRKGSSSVSSRRR